MKTGLYRNTLHAELHVTGVAVQPGGFHTLGEIYYAEMRDPLFGRVHYLVTDKSLSEAGYERVEETDEQR